MMKPRAYPGACSTDEHPGGPYPLDRHLEASPPWVMDLLAYGEGYEPLNRIIRAERVWSLRGGDARVGLR
jgi:hypothetical protein